MARRRFGWCVLLLSTAGVAIACSSAVDPRAGVTPAPSPSTSDAGAPPHTPNTPRAETEVARKELGSEGGQVAGGGATLDIPAGALSANTTIVIKTIDPTGVTIPASMRIAGTVYAFEPDNVPFSKPVTVTVAIDPAKRPANAEGALVLLRSPTAKNEWATRGSGLVTDTTVKAETLHFSDWVPAFASEAACVLESDCSDTSEGFECRIPSTGAGVHCAGNASPYTCTCSGQTDVIATVTTVPAESALRALAVACGAECPPCTVEASCGDWGGSSDPPEAGPKRDGWVCSTWRSTNSLTCEYTQGDPNAYCSCKVEGSDAGDVSFTLPASPQPPSDATILQAWKDKCNGVCAPVDEDGGSAPPPPPPPPPDSN